MSFSRRQNSQPDRAESFVAVFQMLPRQSSTKKFSPQFTFWEEGAPARQRRMLRGTFSDTPQAEQHQNFLATIHFFTLRLTRTVLSFFPLPHRPNGHFWTLPLFFPPYTFYMEAHFPSPVPSYHERERNGDRLWSAKQKWGETLCGKGSAQHRIFLGLRIFSELRKFTT